MNLMIRSGTRQVKRISLRLGRGLFCYAENETGLLESVLYNPAEKRYFRCCREKIEKISDM